MPGYQSPLFFSCFVRNGRAVTVISPVPSFFFSADVCRPSHPYHPVIGVFAPSAYPSNPRFFFSFSFLLFFALRLLARENDPRSINPCRESYVTLAFTLKTLAIPFTPALSLRVFAFAVAFASAFTFAFASAFVYGCVRVCLQLLAREDDPHASGVPDELHGRLGFHRGEQLHRAALAEGSRRFVLVSPIPTVSALWLVVI